MNSEIISKRNKAAWLNVRCSDDVPDNLENAEIKEAQQLQEGEALEHLGRVVKVLFLC